MLDTQKVRHLSIDKIYHRQVPKPLIYNGLSLTKKGKQVTWTKSRMICSHFLLGGQKVGWQRLTLAAGGRIFRRRCRDISSFF